MQVINRHSIKEPVSFDKITKRIQNLCSGLENIDPFIIAKETIASMYNGINTKELDLLSAGICAGKAHHFPDYGKLAGRILMSNLEKETCEEYSSLVKKLYDAGILSEIFFQFVMNNADEIQKMIDYSRDFLFDYFAAKTLERSYLLKINGEIVERPQHMYMRIAIQIHGCHKNGFSCSSEEKLLKIKETYDLLSNQYLTHATPTLFNSGTNRPQLSSCYLLSCDDNIESIFKMLSDIAKISKWSGGIGISLSNIRGKGSKIRGTNGTSDGIIPLCKTLESIGRYINQGGKRNGSIACYLECFHVDIFSFVELRKNTGDDNLRARDLFLALWVCDLFMKRVQNNEEWSLMCPDECPGLVTSYGDEFEKLYIKYENEGRYKKKVLASELWKHILECQVETGMPYISFKDNINKKNMQAQLGTIKNSNLCVAPNTKILTKKEGYQEIQKFSGQSVELWNGVEWSQSVVEKTGENVELYRVHFSNGESIDCTAYHKFPIMNEMVEAVNLKQNMELLHFDLPLLEGSITIENCYYKGYTTAQDNYNEVLYEKYTSSYLDVLASDTTIECKIQWLAGFLKYKSSFLSLRIDFLKKLRLFLHTLGVESYPQQVVNSQIYKLKIRNADIEKLIKLGLKISPNKEDDQYCLTVQSVEKLTELSDTYCFNEPKRHLGIFNGILAGNCNEISLFSDANNIAVCNLASICLPKFVENGSFNFQKLQEVAAVATYNLNNVIDVNYYPTPECKKTNINNRPIGIGVQGLADTFFLLGLPFTSPETKKLNKLIFENIYYGAVKQSIDMAEKYGKYESYDIVGKNGIIAPHKQGLLQFHLWNNTELTLDWDTLIEKQKIHGIRNSLLTAIMPTASTSQICGNSECCEPITSNVYLRKTLAGEFMVVNKYLVNDLMKLGLWDKNMYSEILYDNGSIQKINRIPRKIKEIYKTVYEIKISDILKQAIDRSPFIDHQQSMNLFMSNIDLNVLNSSHFYGWKNGLKTGMYYLRTQPIVNAKLFGIDPHIIEAINKDREKFKDEVNAKYKESCPSDPYIRELCDSCSA
jgi:ribonucleoside-diphosphate reductase alpha chain